MIRTFISRCGLLLATLAVAALSVAQPTDDDRLNRLRAWLNPLDNQWSLAVAQDLFSAMTTQKPNLAKPKNATEYETCAKAKWHSFTFVPILESDVVFQKNRYSAGDWFAQYIPQDRVLLLRNEKKLSPWMRGLLFLSEGYRAYACNVPNGDLETDEDIARLNRSVAEQCFELLCASGGDRYLVFLGKLRKEFNLKKIEIKSSLSESQDKELDEIFMRPVSFEERVLRSKLVRVQAYYGALQGVFGHDKALTMATQFYPIKTVVKR